jgi:hypothetical protein
MDPEEAVLRLARIVSEPDVSDALARVWTKWLSGHEPTEWQQTLLGVWLRVDGNGTLHDSVEAREAADNEMLRD